MYFICLIRKMNIFIQNINMQQRSKISQLHCLKLQISNPNISKSVTNTENCQLGKFLRILSSLPKCLFENSTTYTEKVRKSKF